MKGVENIALEFCRENDIEVTLSYDMPAGYETARKKSCQIPYAKTT